MDINTLSPYVRRAMYSVLKAPFTIKERVIFDYELIFVTGGQAKLTIDSKTYFVKKNNVIFIPPGIEHCIEVIEGAFSQPHIHFDAIYNDLSLQRRISFKPRKRMNPQQLLMIQEDIFKDCDIPYVFTPSDIPKYQKYFFDTIDAWRGNGDLHNLICKADMILLLQLILNQFCKENSSKTAYDYCDALKDHIDHNFNRIITLCDLEKQFGVNKFTMIRNFKKRFGKSVVAYYNSKRMDFAKQQLRDTSRSVTEIAVCLSFSDVYTFSKFFKKNTGLSPKQYRNCQNVDLDK